MLMYMSSEFEDMLAVRSGIPQAQKDHAEAWDLSERQATNLIGPGTAPASGGHQAQTSHAKVCDLSPWQAAHAD